MTYTEIKTDLIINKLTKAQYETLVASNSVSDNELYYIIDDNDRFYTKDEITKLLLNFYTKSDIDDTFYNKTYIDGKLGNIETILASVVNGVEEG